MSPSARVASAACTLAVTAALAAFAAPPATRGDAAVRSAAHVVRVYYFHTAQRCSSCRKIETLAAAAIRSGFVRELGEGSLVFLAVDTDRRENEHFVQDYALYTKSLVVVDLVNGRQTRWKNLPRIWPLLGNEAQFRQYVQREVRAYLDGKS